MTRKEEIIYATLELAATHGLRAVSMQMIADQIGIKKASFYNHFESKEKIIEAMYDFLRKQSKSNVASQGSFEELFANRSLREILMTVVESYRQLCTDPHMYTFYKIVLSERSLDPAAAEIMVIETEKMVQATTMLFYALQAKGYINIKNIESAAFVFAMGVNSIINYECDLSQIGKHDSANHLEKVVDEFCLNYGIE